MRASRAPPVLLHDRNKIARAHGPQRAAGTYIVSLDRIGYTRMSLGQLKVLQEVITLTVFVPFAVLYMKEPLRLNYLWAALCLCGAVYFVFKR